MWHGISHYIVASLKKEAWKNTSSFILYDWKNSFWIEFEGSVQYLFRESSITHGLNLTFKILKGPVKGI